MRLPVIYFGFAALLISCSGLISDSETASNIEFLEFSYSFSHELNDIENKDPKGFQTISGFQKSNSENILRLPQEFSQFVFAVNSKEEPILAGYPDESSHITFGSEQTAVTLIELFAVNFISDSKSALTDEIYSHPEFENMVSKIDQLVRQKESFINDSEVFMLINTIHKDLGGKYFRLNSKNNFIKGTLSDNNTLLIKTESKLPFSVSGTHEASENLIGRKLLNGEKLDSEKSFDKSDIKTQFLLIEGANSIKISNDKSSQLNRFKKTATDLILKMQITIGINNYSNRDLSHSIDQIFPNSFQPLSDSDSHLKLVLGELSNNKTEILKYLNQQLPEPLLKNKNTSQYFDILTSLLLNQGKEAIIFSDDSYYDDINEHYEFESEQVICIQNVSEVPCSISSSEISYSIGTAGCRDNEFEIKFGSRFYAPFGLDKGSKLKIEWEYENGRSGFWLISYSDKKEKVTGLNSTLGCFNFGDKSKLILREQVIDHLGNRGNVSNIEIDRPKSKQNSLINYSESAALVQN